MFHVLARERRTLEPHGQITRVLLLLYYCLILVFGPLDIKQFRVWLVKGHGWC